MKKRILSLFLALVLLLSVLPAVSSADAPEEDAPAIDETALRDALASAAVPENDDPIIDEAALQEALDHAMQHPELTHPLELPEAEEGGGEIAPATRQPQEDNLVMPGPLMEGCAAKQGDRMRLPIIRYQTGKPNQAVVILIFRGKGVNGEPVETLFANFPQQAGIFEGDGAWDTKNASLGVYTAVTCTASLNGSQYEVVEGTASAEYIYVLDHYAPVTAYYYADEKGNRLDKLVTDGTELCYVYIKHEPAIATDITDLHFNSSGGNYEEYNGLIIGYPTVYGWWHLSIEPNYSDLGPYYLDVDVCINKDGHHAEQTELRTATEYVEGATLYYCPDCYTSDIVYSPSTVAVFNELHDVPESQWYYDSVKGAVLRGLFNGVSPSRFNPNDTMTRAMLVTVLWRYAGAPAEGANKFSDVPAGQWYTGAVAWAAHNHIVDGVGGGRFAPNDTITREQMAAILYRYAGTIKEDTSARADLDGFADRAKVSGWASDAIRWCVAAQYIGGSRSGDKLLLDPQGSATRAQVAAILMRFLKNVDPSMKCEPLDTTGAEASGNYTHWNDESCVMIEWAFFPDGTLVFGGGDGRIPNAGSSFDAADAERYDMPWDAYIERTKTIKVLGGVKSIGISAFRDYPNLETVILPDSLYVIHRLAFMNCTSLKSIRWPEYSFGIEPQAFNGCTALEEVVLPEGLYKVAFAFVNCTGLKKIYFPDTLLSEFFYGGSMSMRSALNGCTALTEVRLPAGMTEIQDSLFRNCKSLKTVEFPKATSYIRDGAFEGCESLKTLVLPMQIYKMGDRVFLPEESFEEPADYVDTCGLTDLYILNPYFESVGHKNYQGGKYYTAPFGNPERVTVHAWSGTFVEELAREKGYTFVPLD